MQLGYYAFMRFSLIVATLERVGDVELLLNSLCAQSFDDFEVIVVDQNDDDRLADLIARFNPRLNLTRLRSSTRKLSHARNLGIKISIGDIIAFPDDDCIYPEDVLAHVDAQFQKDARLAILSGPAFSPAGQLGSGRWQGKSAIVTMRTVWTSVIAFNLFIRGEWVKQAGGFDEALGVGARFGSGEETDLVIRIMKAGGKAYYDFGLRVIHPDKALSNVAVVRAFSYGTGMGHVLRKHQIANLTRTSFLLRPVGGLLISLLKRNFLAANYYWQTFKGRISGFLARSGNL